MSHAVQLTPVTPLVAKNAIQSALGIRIAEFAGQCSLDLIVAEYIRTWLTPNSSGRSAEHIVSRSVLLSRVRSQLDCLVRSLQNSVASAAEAASSDLIDRVFRRLRFIREVVELPSGFVQLAPFRLVSISDQDALVIGGGDCKAVLTHIGLETEFHAFARSVTRESLAEKLATDNQLPTQNLHSWSGLPRIGLSTWFHLVIERSRRIAIPGGGGEDACLVYLPRLDRNQSRVNRWIPLTSVGASEVGPFLIRENAKRPQYCLVWTRNHRTGLTITSQDRLSRTDAIRLQFCIDHQRGMCDTLAIAHEAGKCRMILRRRLPHEEERILAALCIQQSSPSTTERILEFDPRWLPAIESTFRALLWNVEIANGIGGTQ